MTEKIFITGTDTGVGKTVLTAFMLWGMRRLGLKALAMKPLCSGGREDAEVLNRFQERELPLEVMNPYSFLLAASPLIAARKERKKVSLVSVAQSIERVAAQCDWLLIEGAGGLLSPLGEGFTMLDLILQWKSKVVVAGKNQLGIMNHVLLTDSVLRQNGVQNAGYWLVEGGVRGGENEIEQTNLALLGELLGGGADFFDARHG